MKKNLDVNNLFFLFFLFVLLLIFLSGCNSDETSDDTIDENSQTNSNDDIEKNKTSIKCHLEEISVSGANCRIKVIDPDSNNYGVDQPAPGMEIPLFLQSNNSKSQLRIRWTDLDSDQKIDDNDILELFTVSDNNLISGDWYIQVFSKSGNEILYSSGAVKIS